MAAFSTVATNYCASLRVVVRFVPRCAVDLRAKVKAMSHLALRNSNRAEVSRANVVRIFVRRLRPELRPTAGFSFRFLPPPADPTKPDEVRLGSGRRRLDVGP